MYNRKTKKHEGYIYKITNTENGRVYIGRSIVVLGERWRHHRNLLNKAAKGREIKCNKRMLCDWKKFGGERSFKFDVIEQIKENTEEDLFEKITKAESYYINLYDSKNDRLGYNIADPVMPYKLQPFTSEQKDKISDSIKGWWNLKKVNEINTLDKEDISKVFHLRLIERISYGEISREINNGRKHASKNDFRPKISSGCIKKIFDHKIRDVLYWVVVFRPDENGFCYNGVHEDVYYELMRATIHYIVITMIDTTLNGCDFDEFSERYNLSKNKLMNSLEECSLLDENISTLFRIIGLIVFREKENAHLKKQNKKEQNKKARKLRMETENDLQTKIAI